jgi:hypothetical protein
MGCCCYPEPNPDGTQNCVEVTGPEACMIGGLYSSESCQPIAGGDCAIQAIGNGAAGGPMLLATIAVAALLRRRVSRAAPRS